MNTRTTVVKNAMTAIVSLGAIIGTVYGFTAFIDARIERITATDDFLSKVASRVRPSCIFNHKGSILADMGAMEIIENISMTNYNKALPGTIIVTPRKYLANAPILSTIDPFTLNVVEERGNKYDWVYHVGYASASFSDDPFGSIRFRLEVVK